MFVASYNCIYCSPVTLFYLLGTASDCHGSCAMGLGTQRTWRYDRMLYIRRDIKTFLFLLQSCCIYFCMYLSQAISFPPGLGIESDLFACVHQAEEVESEPAEVTCSAVLPPSPTELLHSRHVHHSLDCATKHAAVIAADRPAQHTTVQPAVESADRAAELSAIVATVS